MGACSLSLPRSACFLNQRWRLGAAWAVLGWAVAGRAGSGGMNEEREPRQGGPSYALLLPLTLGFLFTLCMFWRQKWVIRQLERTQKARVGLGPARAFDLSRVPPSGCWRGSFSKRGHASQAMSLVIAQLRDADLNFTADGQIVGTALASDQMAYAIQGYFNPNLGKFAWSEKLGDGPQARRWGSARHTECTAVGTTRNDHGMWTKLRGTYRSVSWWGGPLWGNFELVYYGPPPARPLPTLDMLLSLDVLSREPPNVSIAINPSGAPSIAWGPTPEAPIPDSPPPELAFSPRSEPLLPDPPRPEPLQVEVGCPEPPIADPPRSEPLLPDPPRPELLLPDAPLMDPPRPDAPRPELLSHPARPENAEL